MRGALFPKFKMSADEDTELRDLVAQTLETNGTLGKIRAQLRASVFLALEEQESVQNKTPFLNKDLQQFLSTKGGRQVAGLVREFLEFFDLEFTLAVFDPETGLGPDYDKRATLAKELNLPDTGSAAKSPLLLEALNRGEQKSDRPTLSKHRSIADDSGEIINIPKELTEKQILAAREKFEYYDKDDSGTIDKDELRQLFMDVFPHFHKNMLERYVNDEFRSVDRNFSNSIDFEEFLEMYKRLFLLCRTVVSGDVDEIVFTTPKKLREPPTSPPSSKVLTWGVTTPWQRCKQQLANTRRFQSSSYAENKNFFNSLEAKNQKNLENNKQPSSEASNGPKNNSLIDFGSDIEGDPFFDDPVPSAGGSLNISNRSVSPVSSRGRRSSPSRPSQIPVYKSGSRSDDKAKDSKAAANGAPAQKSGAGTAASSNMSSLQGLPSLTSNKGQGQTTQAQDSPRDSSEANLRSLDKRMADFGLNDGPDEFEYEDDFQDSIHSSSVKSPRLKSENKSVNENGGGSITEEIEEEDISTFSIEGDDLLKSDRSGFDDMTTDKSISQADGGFDYAEEVMLP